MPSLKRRLCATRLAGPHGTLQAGHRRHFQPWRPISAIASSRPRFRAKSCAAKAALHTNTSCAQTRRAHTRVVQGSRDTPNPRRFRSTRFILYLPSRVSTASLLSIQQPLLSPMGLDVQVGLLSHLIANENEEAESVAHLSLELLAVDTVLKDNDAPGHVEPRVLPPLKSRARRRSFPYSYLHHLRRFYARVTADPDWTPCGCPQGENPAEDPTVEEEMYMLRSHLLCHSDSAGFYVPVPFACPVADERVPGGFVGSSLGLNSELLKIAHELGISIAEGHVLEDADFYRIQSSCDGSEFEKELIVWLCLFEACRLSIEQGAAITFC